MKSLQIMTVIALVLFTLVFSVGARFVHAETLPGQAPGTAPGAGSRPDMQVLNNEGRLFSVKMMPAAKNIKLYVTEKEAATVNPEGIQVNANLVEPEKRRLGIQKAGDHFIITEVPKKPAVIEVHTKKEGKAESFKFRIQDAP